MAANKIKFINGVPAEDIIKHYEFDPALVERVAVRKTAQPEVAIYDYNPEWPAQFQVLKQRIIAALGPVQKEEPTPASPAGGDGGDADKLEKEGGLKVLGVHHRGSTSVPGLPAKNTIDIDLILSDNTLEHLYVPALEAAGFQFLIREPGWHQHRFFAVPASPGPPSSAGCNLHVWGPRCPEAERHRIFHEWLIAHADDRELYAKTKRECAEVSARNGEKVMEYNLRKEWVIREILARAFKELGISVDEGETPSKA